MPPGFPGNAPHLVRQSDGHDGREVQEDGNEEALKREKILRSHCTPGLASIFFTRDAKLIEL